MTGDPRLPGPSDLPDLTGRRIAVLNWRDPWHRHAGGAERYAWEFARGLRDAGAEVDFVTARDSGQLATEVRDGIRVVRRGGRFGYYPAVAGWVLRHRGRLDAVVDAACGVPTFSPLVLRRGTPVVLLVHHVHQQQFTTYFPGPVAAFGRFLERLAMPRVYRRARTLAVSRSTHEEMVNQLGWTGPVGLLANGADQSGDQARAGEPGRLVVLGRLVPHKRVDLVLDAVATLRRERSDLILDVCGTGPDLDRLRARVRDLGLADRVTVHGWVDEATKHELLSRAALHVCASDAEGWGQVVVEAAAYGVPTVARDVPGLRDSIRRGETGWIVPDHPGDLAATGRLLTERIRASLRHLDDPELRDRHDRACRDWAAGFSWERMRTEAAAIVHQEICPTVHLTRGSSPCVVSSHQA